MFLVASVTDRQGEASDFQETGDRLFHVLDEAATDARLDLFVKAMVLPSDVGDGAVYHQGVSNNL